MLAWKRLHLYEDFFYSATAFPSSDCEELREAGSRTVYRRCSGGAQGEKALPGGLYLFLQLRQPVDEIFWEEHRADAESFLLHKKSERASDSVFFRTLEEDGQKAYQIWIPIRDRSIMSQD